MLRVYSFIAISLILSSCLATRSSTNKYTLVETKHFQPDQKAKSILVIGQGGTGAHFFLEELSKELQKKFQKNNVSVGYEYLGYKEDVATRFKEILAQKNYDAILRFVPSWEEPNPVVIDYYSTPAGRGTVSGTKASVRLTQDFKIILYKKEDLSKALWEGDLSANLDPRVESFYPKLAGELLQYLKGLVD